MFLNEYGAAVTKKASELESVLAPALATIDEFAKPIDIGTWAKMRACMELSFDRKPVTLDSDPLVDRACELGYEVYFQFLKWKERVDNSLADDMIAYCYARLALTNTLAEITLRKAMQRRKTGCGKCTDCKCHVQA